MPWIETHITTKGEYANTLSIELSLLGANAITFHDAGDEPLYEPNDSQERIWKKTIVIGLFDDQHPMTDVTHFLEKQKNAGLIEDYHLHTVSDEDWVKRSLQDFHPIPCGQRLWICPSWHEPPNPNAINVMLDPGMAFGTGTHPTTALCLQWLDAHIDSAPLVIDYGCGSGILGIAALKLGAKKVIAVDHDPQALSATVSNAKQNKLYPPDLQVYSPEELPRLQADLVIANILLEPLLKLTSVFAAFVKPQGSIVVSGILTHQVEIILSAYQPWFDMQPPVFKDEWALLAGIRRKIS